MDNIVIFIINGDGHILVKLSNYRHSSSERIFGIVRNLYFPDDFCNADSKSTNIRRENIYSNVADGFFHNNINIWDIAAGILLVKEAGGIISEINLNKKGNIKLTASSEIINDKLGKPLYLINLKIKKKIKEKKKINKFELFLSISDEKDYSIAFTIIQKI